MQKPDRALGSRAAIFFPKRPYSVPPTSRRYRADLFDEAWYVGFHVTGTGGSHIRRSPPRLCEIAERNRCGTLRGRVRSSCGCRVWPRLRPSALTREEG